MTRLLARVAVGFLISCKAQPSSDVSTPLPSDSATVVHRDSSGSRITEPLPKKASTLRKNPIEVQGSKAVADSLSIRLVLPDTVLLNEIVAFKIALLNLTREPVRLRHYQTRPSWNFIVNKEPEATPLYSRSNSRLVQVVCETVMLPFDSLVIAGTWPQSTGDGSAVPSGDYSMIGVIYLAGRELRTLPKRFRIVQSESQNASTAINRAEPQVAVGKQIGRPEIRPGCSSVG